MATQRHGPTGGYYWVPLELGVRGLSRRLIRSVDSRWQLCSGVLSVEPLPLSQVLLRRNVKLQEGLDVGPSLSCLSTAASDRRAAAIGWSAGAPVDLFFLSMR
jgi:hypothetical protein